jgi:crossover junction endonuclease EME1
MEAREWNEQTTDIIKFVRKVDKEWNDQEGFFQPCELHKKDEEWIIHWLHADTFIDLTCRDQTGLQLQFHIEKLKRALPGAKVIIILEGLESMLSKARNARVNIYDTAARRIGGLQGARRNIDESLLDLDEDAIQDELIKMQLVHEIRILQTASTLESAEWVATLATDISSIPYRYIIYKDVLTADALKCF